MFACNGGNVDKTTVEFGKIIRYCVRENYLTVNKVLLRFSSGAVFYFARATLLAYIVQKDREGERWVSVRVSCVALRP